MVIMLPYKPHIWYDMTNAGMSWICGSPSVYATPPYGYGNTPAEAYAHWFKRFMDRQEQLLDAIRM